MYYAQSSTAGIRLNTRARSALAEFYSWFLSVLAVLLLAVLPLVPTAQAQMLASSTRLEAFENTTLSGKQVPFVIEEMQVGYIRHLIDYLLLHGRYNVESGKSELAGAQLQWAASLMDLNAGLTNSSEQTAVRKAAAKIDDLAQALASGTAPSDAHARLFKAHHAMATYHQRRAVMLLDATTPSSTEAELIRKNAVFQKKAGLALSAALTHYDRATALLSTLKETPVTRKHKDDVKKTYTFVEALQVARGQVDAEKAHSAVEGLGLAIAALRLE